MVLLTIALKSTMVLQNILRGVVSFVLNNILPSVTYFPSFAVLPARLHQNCQAAFGIVGLKTIHI